jgi:hypothetical protein
MWLGKVTGASSQVTGWKVDIYPDGSIDSSTTYNVDVHVIATCTVQNSLYVPIGTWVWPIYEFPDPQGGDDQYFWYAPIVGKVAFTPSGGIAAMSGTTPGSASCNLYDFNGTSLVSNNTAYVFNTTTASVGGSKYIQTKLIDGCLFVDVEPC